MGRPAWRRRRLLLLPAAAASIQVGHPRPIHPSTSSSLLAPPWTRPTNHRPPGPRGPRAPAARPRIPSPAVRRGPGTRSPLRGASISFFFLDSPPPLPLPPPPPPPIPWFRRGPPPCPCTCRFPSPASRGAGPRISGELPLRPARAPGLSSPARLADSDWSEEVGFSLGCPELLLIVWFG